MPNDERITATDLSDAAYQIKAIAREETRQAIMDHIRLCPFATDQVGTRLRSIEMRFATLIGIMIGSGVLGGMAGGAISHLLTTPH
jgi:hypothetical protein